MSVSTRHRLQQEHREFALAGLLRRDPRHIVLHRAVRVTLACCVGFYLPVPDR